VYLRHHCTDMAFCLEHLAGTAIVLLFTVSLCDAKIVRYRFTEKKSVGTNHTTLHSISDIQCVRKCNKERQNGRCTLAGYDKRTKTCYLSDDDPQNVVDTEDEMTGVFYGPDVNGRGMIIFLSTSVYFWKHLKKVIV